LSLETTEPVTFGHGWISGLLSAVLGVVALGTVVCFHHPTFLTMPELQSYYNEYLSYIRALLHVFLVASFLLGVLSVCLRRNKTLGRMALPQILSAVSAARRPAVNASEIFVDCCR
jgi:hypothetical protein